MASWGVVFLLWLVVLVAASSNCHPRCAESLLGNGQCDKACASSACAYDKGDCDSSGLLEIEIDAQQLTTHHTSQYQGVNVIRRGLPVTISIDKLGNSDLSEVALEHQGTRHKVKAASVTSAGKKVAKFVVPVSTPVGWYTVTAQVPGESKALHSSQPLAIIFNPWSDQDSVYMEEPMEANEYITSSEVGIGKGDDANVANRAYVYTVDQFDPLALQLALEMLDGDKADQADPVAVSRTLLQGVNRLLVGKWHGPWGDGVEPTDWDGSGQLIHKYFATRRPVKYAECWVYAMMLCTMGRTLGIPARVVTGVDIAVPKRRPRFLEVMRIWDFNRSSGKLELNEQLSDKVWGWHVWTEMFMGRKDIREPQAGWQVLDATPQADGNFMGPARRARLRGISSVISKGMLNNADACGEDASHRSYCTLYKDAAKGLAKHYDDASFLARQLGTRVKLLRVAGSSPAEGPYLLAKYQPLGMGTFFVTQQPNGFRGDLMDLTCFYRQPCKETLKKESNSSAVHVHGGSPNFLFEPELPDVTVPAGQSITLRLRVRLVDPDLENPSMHVMLKGTVAHRWHSSTQKNTKFFEKLIVLPMHRTQEEATFVVEPSKFMPLLASTGETRIALELVAAPGTDTREPGDIFMRTEPPSIVTIQVPQLRIESAGPVRPGKTLPGAILWENPTQEALTNCKLRLRASSKEHGREHITHSTIGMIAPRSKFRHTFALPSTVHGPQTLVQARLRCSNFLPTHGYGMLKKCMHHTDAKKCEPKITSLLLSNHTERFPTPSEADEIQAAAATAETFWKTVGQDKDWTHDSDSTQDQGTDDIVAEGSMQESAEDAVLEETKSFSLNPFERDEELTSILDGMTPTEFFENKE